jgi:pyruvate dehydrogenase E2 component (dihydrolipoamide acetyltransferase)
VAHPILMPKPGQMTEECVVVAWHKQEGDPVHKGDVLFEIETDKSVMDVETFDDGVLLRRYVEEGQSVPVNSICAYVGEPGEVVPDEIPTQAASSAVAPASTTTLPVTPASPAAAVPPAAAAAAADPVVADPAVADRAARLAISPRASRLAAASGIDPRTVRGTGPGGRITEQDVQAAIDAVGAASNMSAPPGTPAAAATPPVPVQPTATATDDEEPRPLSRMRRVIAERLTLSATTIPQFHVAVSVDMTRLLGLRAELRDAGVELSVTDFIAAATAQTLAEFPEVNSRTDGTTVWLRRRVHLGLAVSVPGGLVVPVIRDADRCSLAQFHERASILAAAARSGTLAPDDMAGSTFTVSNLGMFGVDQFDAIINPGEAAILAVSSVIPTPVVAGDGLAVRQVMKLTLTADHRLVDGELGARFLNALRRRLQDVEAIRTEALHA